MTLAVPSQPRGRIYLLKDKNQVTRLEAMPYDSEDFLQGLLEDHPDLLASEQINPDEPRRWLRVAHEMGVAHDEGGDRWSVDHFFVDHDAVPTLVEVKRSSDTRVRREVVGQMLDYAANASVQWTAEKLGSTFKERCRKNGQDPDETLSRFLGYETKPIEFWEMVTRNLRDTRVRMLFVADRIPSELRRIVEFLDQSMDRAEVLAVEIPQFLNDGVSVFAPRLVTEQPRPKRGGPYEPVSQEEFLDAARKQTGDEVTVAAMKKLLGWAERKRLPRGFGLNNQRSRATIYLPGGRDEDCLIYMWANGNAWLEMRRLKSCRPFDKKERREELRAKLEGVQARRKGANMEGQPSLDLRGISKDGQPEALTEQVGWLVKQCEEAG